MLLVLSHFFFFNDTATTEIYTLSLHDALPIYISGSLLQLRPSSASQSGKQQHPETSGSRTRSEEHTSELQSPCNLVCRLLLEKKNISNIQTDAERRPHDTCHLSFLVRLSAQLL